jgi:hypothetical protein
MAELWDAKQVEILRWLHILAMVYWLGGEWGVFQTSYNVINPRLSLEERKRHMETAYRIDILARTGIILLLPLGLHMGHLYGLQPLGGWWLVLMWVMFAAWLGLTWSAFFARETDLGLALTKADEAIRYVVIPALVFVGIWSFIYEWPLATPEGAKWYAAKVALYGGLLIIGLLLRYIMRGWTEMFRILAQGPDEKVEAELNRQIQFGRGLAYVYWIGIATVGFLGAVKPF